MILILRQATFRNGDAYGHLLDAAKNFECNDVTYTHVEHHIDDMILTGDLGGIAVHGGADENVLGLKDSVCERAA